MSYYRNLNDFNGSKKLNQKLLNIISNYLPDLIVLGHADLIKPETLVTIKKNYPNTKIVQWFLDRMDSHWIHNKKRFIDKINLMDVNFCTTSPETLNFKSSHNTHYLPNPVDESLETLENYKNKFYKSDVFCNESWCTQRCLKKR